MTSKEALDRLHDLALPSSSSETWEHRKRYCEKLYNIIKKDLNRVKEVETNYHCALATLEAQKEEIRELREELNVEKEFYAEKRLVVGVLQTSNLATLKKGNTQACKKLYAVRENT